MKYLIVQDWISTRGNHAGMVHMCEMLKVRYPDEYGVIIKEKTFENYTNKHLLTRKWRSAQHLWYTKYGCTKTYLSLCHGMFSLLKAGDEVFLLEYMLLGEPQLGLAKYIRRKFPDVKIYALCHLTPTFYKNPTIYPKIILKWSEYVDKVLTLGSSLSTYFINNGLETSKVSTGFHYVDNKYYCKDKISIVGKRPKVIMLGGMQRNYSMLSEVIKNTPYVDWVVCRGKKKVDEFFEGLNNVTLKGYIAEFELLNLMDSADISVNIMADTVGSNVITTSLAMGLAMIVSDVGSIRDYCDETNAIFCDNTVESYVNAISKLCSQEKLLIAMKKSSLRKSKTLSIVSINDWFCSL